MFINAVSMFMLVSIIIMVVLNSVFLVSSGLSLCVCVVPDISIPIIMSAIHNVIMIMSVSNEHYSCVIRISSSPFVFGFVVVFIVVPSLLSLSVLFV